MLRRRITIGALLLTLGSVPAMPAFAQGPAMPVYELVGRDDNGLELRFHNMPLKGVHADDSQNALSLDFQMPVDGAVFDRLAGDLPQWIAMAYANFDNGVIRANRPVTFLTRSEPDGFSLRIVARGPAPQVMAQGGPQPGYGVPVYGPPPAIRGQVQEYGPPAAGPGAPPPMNQVFHRYDDYGAIRNYEALSLAVRRADPIWGQAYGRATMQSDSNISLASELKSYHGGDLMIATDLDGKLTLAPGSPLSAMSN